MANEFIARKGLISLGDSQVTGSLETTSNLNVEGSGSFGNNQFLIGTVTNPNAATGFNSTFEFQNGPSTYSSQLVFRPKGNTTNYNANYWGSIRWNPGNESGLTILAGNYKTNILFGRGSPSSANPQAFAKLNNDGLRLQSSYIQNIATAEEKLHVVGNAKITGFVTASGNLITEANITASGHVSASTYYGDGSNLTSLPTQDPFPYTGDVEITGSNSLAGNYALKVTNTSGADILNVENDGKTSLLTPTLNGTTIFSTGDTTLKITDGQSGNQRGPIFETFGDAGGWNGAYDFKTGYNGGTTTTSAFKIIGRGSNGANTAVGIGNFGINILETNSPAQLVVEKHTMTTSNRNEAIRLLNNQSNVDSDSDSTYYGIQFNGFDEGTKGGSYIGTQTNDNGGGYSADFVVLATGNAQSSYSEIARFVGWNKSFYIGEDRDVINSSYKLQVDGAVSASTYYGDGSNLTGISSDPFPYTGSAIISGSLEVTGSAIVTGDITTNTLSNISTTLASDSATNVDTFATATYTGAIYDYILIDATVGARTGQFMVAQDNGNITFTDTSTKHLTDSPIPEITAQINGANVEVQVTNGNGYTFKSFTKKL